MNKILSNLLSTEAVDDRVNSFVYFAIQHVNSTHTIVSVFLVRRLPLLLAIVPFRAQSLILKLVLNTVPEKRYLLHVSILLFLTVFLPSFLKIVVLWLLLERRFIKSILTLLQILDPLFWVGFALVRIAMVKLLWCVFSYLYQLLL